MFMRVRITYLTYRHLPVPPKNCPFRIIRRAVTYLTLFTLFIQYLLCYV